MTIPINMIALNNVLSQAGIAPYFDPIEFPVEEVFDAQMLGYSGLHAIRRLAAHLVCTGRLPDRHPIDDYANDPLIERLNAKILDALSLKPTGFSMMGFLRPRPRLDLNI